MTKLTVTNFSNVLYVTVFTHLHHSTVIGMSGSGGDNHTSDSYYRHDGVRISHDPFAPGMAEKYGLPGKTDNEGFDPYSDSVGAGIYGGIVKRDQNGEVVIGEQYQNHNPRPGPVYAGGGYAPSAKALKNIKGSLIPLLNKFPDLANDITTGGASPLHMCGMSRENQKAVSALIAYGADIESLDTYGMTPLHRMASNNLAEGAKLLIEAGANPENKGKISITPKEMAEESRAADVLKVLQNKSTCVYPAVNIRYLIVSEAGFAPVNGTYYKQSFTSVPVGFASVCETQNWNSSNMWSELNGQKDWYKHENSYAYIYYNNSDKKWWIDGPAGLGVYITLGPKNSPPGHGWTLIQENVQDKRSPVVLAFRDISEETTNSPMNE